MKKIKIYGSVLIALSLAACPLFSFAEVPTQLRLVKKTILDYEKELKLTPQQKDKIKIYLEDLKKKNKEIVTMVNAIDKQVLSLLENNQELEIISKKVKESFDLRAEALIAEIEIARKIEKLLSFEQLNKWKEIKLNETKKIMSAPIIKRSGG